MADASNDGAKVRRRRYSRGSSSGFIAKPTKRQQAILDKKAALVAEIKRREQEAVADRKRIADELSRRKPALPGNRGDGQFHLGFIRVGQGDCTIMTTPQGRVIMIDCGSTAADKDIADQEEIESASEFLSRAHGAVYDKKFLKGSKRLDILILTHSDQDHYNKITSILDKNVAIGDVYYSSNQANASIGLLASYNVRQTSSWIKARVAKTMSEQIARIKLVENNNNNKTRTIKINGHRVLRKSKGVDFCDANGAIRIVDEEKCKVFLLAGGVQSGEGDTDNSTPQNRGSLVTLVELSTKKETTRILICGDATTITEGFLMERYGTSGRISNVDLLRAAHHGSTTSSSRKFVYTVNPYSTVISAPQNVPLHHLPRSAIITRYILNARDNSRVGDDPHTLYGWSAGAMNSFHYTKLPKTKHKIYVTGLSESFLTTVKVANDAR